MLRWFAYVLCGWLLIALVGGLADVMHLTIMLPATSAVVVTHVAFSRGTSVPFGLSVAVALGYLEDLHQGSPMGTLCLAHAFAFVLLRWASARLHLRGWILRAVASVFAVLLIDALTWAVLFALAEPFGLRREALASSITDARWHALATLLAAPPVWALIERVFALLRLEDKPPHQAYWSGK
jgi:cell shape-determining protein MreD